MTTAGASSPAVIPPADDSARQEVEDGDQHDRADERDAHDEAGALAVHCSAFRDHSENADHDKRDRGCGDDHPEDDPNRQHHPLSLRGSECLDGGSGGSRSHSMPSWPSSAVARRKGEGLRAPRRVRGGGVERHHLGLHPEVELPADCGSGALSSRSRSTPAPAEPRACAPCSGGRRGVRRVLPHHAHSADRDRVARLGVAFRS